MTRDARPLHGLHRTTREFETRVGCGYLRTTAGELVDVIYVGSGPDEDGWLYARRRNEPCDSGLLPQSTIREEGDKAIQQEQWSKQPQTQQPQQIQQAHSPSGHTASDAAALDTAADQTNCTEFAVACRDVSQASSGYLNVKAGERLSILYHGSHAEGDAAWIYADRGGERGWLLRCEVKPCQEKQTVGTTTAPASQCEAATDAFRCAVPTPAAQTTTTTESRALPASTLELLRTRASGANSSARVPPLPAPSTVGSRGRVRLLTFGLENCVAELIERCCAHPSGGASIQINEDELRTALRRGVGENVDVVVDARRFPDPDAYSLTRHIGVHHEIIARLVRHRNFPRWFKGVKQQFLDLAGATASMSMAIYCKAGKHRSVAGATILEHCLREEGWDCSLRHLSQTQWNKKYCCQGLCEECRNPPKELEDTLGTALRMWREM